MIDLVFNTQTKSAKLATNTPIVSAGDVPVRVVFTPATGKITAIRLGLASGETVPVALAYTDVFSTENSEEWSGLLDASDTRLATFMTDKGTASVNIQLVVVINGETIYVPNVAQAVQKSAFSGPSSPSTGPTYYTRAQVDALLSGLGGGGGIDTALSAFTGSGGLGDVLTASLPVNTTYKRFYVAGSGLVDFRLVAGPDTPVTGEKIRGPDYVITSNEKFWLRV